MVAVKYLRAVIAPLTLLAVACAATSLERAVEALPVGTQWQLASSSEAPLQGAAAQAVRLQFTAEGLSGDSSCNGFSLPLSVLPEGGLQLGPLQATKRGCIDQRAAVEQALFALLRNASALRWQGEQLLLQSHDGAHILLQRMAGETP